MPQVAEMVPCSVCGARLEYCACTKIAALEEQVAALRSGLRDLHARLMKRYSRYEGKRQAYPEDEAWWRARAIEAGEIAGDVLMLLGSEEEAR